MSKCPLMNPLLNLQYNLNSFPSSLSPFMSNTVSSSFIFSQSPYISFCLLLLSVFVLVLFFSFRKYIGLSSSFTFGIILSLIPSPSVCLWLVPFSALTRLGQVSLHLTRLGLPLLEALSFTKTGANMCNSSL